MFLNIPKTVLDRMTKDEVRRLLAEMRDELEVFEGWNEDRREIVAAAPPWQESPPPKSLDDYGKMRVR
ncbi:MAG TPA: hypothetical protein VGG68_15740 [Caulobacteraceae bacterium]